MDLVKMLRQHWDRVGAWLCVVVGAIVLIAGWAGVSRTAYPAEQLPHIMSGGVGGLFLLGLGAMLWLSADLRDEWRKLDRIEAAIREKGTLLLDVDPFANSWSAARPPAPAVDEVVPVPSGSGSDARAGEVVASASNGNGNGHGSRRVLRVGDS